MGYVEDFEKLGFGMFVHFGVYSLIGKGEWIKHDLKISDEEYDKLLGKFNVKKNWAKNLVSAAKKAGCKYITLTTRHHDGFSLYDTKGLNEYDAPHSACGRDLVREFVDECNKQNVVPFFYHTLLDWHVPEYKTDFPAYIDYLVESIKILCTNYGKIGGLWFDGMWDKPDADWQEDRIYGTIRKYQPTAMIVNNTGLSEQGKVGHHELDSVTFERGNPRFVDNSDRHRAGEMCQVLNDHWGYAEHDCNYKSVKELIENLVDCRSCNCNFLLNVGPKPSGDLRTIDRGILEAVGAWVKANKGFIYGIKASDVEAENAFIVRDEKYHYAIIKDVPMSADPNVQLGVAAKTVAVNADIKSAVWLDNGQPIEVKDNSFKVVPFSYGHSYSVRVARFSVK